MDEPDDRPDADPAEPAPAGGDFDALGDAVGDWDAPPQADEPVPKGPSRQALGIWIGVGLGVVVVGAVLALTLLSGSSEQSKREASTTTTADPNVPASTLPEEITAETIPEGDYTAFCAELVSQTSAFSTTDQLAALRTAYEQVDFPKLIASAPEGLQPSLELLQASKDQILKVTEGISSMAELKPADYPEGFLAAFGLVGRAAIQKCPDLSKGVAAPTSTAPAAGG